MNRAGVPYRPPRVWLPVALVALFLALILLLNFGPGSAAETVRAPAVQNTPTPTATQVPLVYLSEVKVLHIGGTPGLPHPNYPGDSGDITPGHTWYKFVCTWTGCDYHDISFDLNWSDFPAVLTPGGSFTFNASARGQVDVRRGAFPRGYGVGACFERLDGGNDYDCVGAYTPDLTPNDPNMQGEQKTLTYQIPMAARYGYNIGVHVTAGVLDARVWYIYKPLPAGITLTPTATPTLTPTRTRTPTATPTRTVKLWLEESRNWVAADGQDQVEITAHVVDAQTEAPVSGVAVLFVLDPDVGSRSPDWQNSGAGRVGEDDLHCARCPVIGGRHEPGDHPGSGPRRRGSEDLDRSQKA